MDPRLAAAVELIGRTGALNYQIRYSEAEDGVPAVWAAVASYPGDRYEVDAAFDPLQATFRLATRLVDGGQCSHCHRPTGFDEDFGTMPLGDLVCWYQYDPERETFRRGCEGNDK